MIAQPEVPSNSNVQWRATRLEDLRGWQFGLFLLLLVALSYPLVSLGVDTFFYRDYGVLAYPTVHYYRESFWRFELPLWNPLSHCGVPFLAQWGTMVLYPLSLIHLVLPLPWSLGVFSLGHLWLAGMGMFLLTARWTDDRFAAAVAGVAYTFGGLTFSSLMWPNWVAALGWLPWIVFAGQQAGKRGGLWLVYAGVLGAFQMLTGVPEVVLLTWSIVAVLWGAAWIQRSRELFRFCWRGAIVVLLVGLLTAAQLLPFLELLSHSQRHGGFSDLRWAMPGWGWANLVVPLFHCFVTPQSSFVQHGQQFFTSYYPGLLVLLLGVNSCRRLNSVPQRIALVLLAIGSIMALGPDGYLYSWFRNAIPGMGLGRYPVKFFVLGAFALPVLAAYAVAELRRSSEAELRKTWRTLCLGAGLLLIAGAWLLWFARQYPFPYDQWDVTARNFTARLVYLAAGLVVLRLIAFSQSTNLRGVAGMVFLVLVWMDLRFHWPSHNPTLPASALVPGLCEIKPPPKAGVSRIYIAPWAGNQLLRSGVPDRALDLLGKRLAMWSNLNILEGVPNVGGAMTLRLRYQEEVQKRLEERELPGPLPLLDYLAVSHVTASNNPVQWQSRDSWQSWISAGQATTFVDESESLDVLFGDTFEPGTILLPSSIAAQVVPAATEFDHELRVERFSPQHIRLNISAEAPAFVTLAHSFYHPWQATVNGNAVPIWRANHAFQAIQVPAGNHQVDLRYRDQAFLWGGFISIFGLVGCWVANFHNRPRQTSC